MTPTKTYNKYKTDNKTTAQLIFPSSSSTPQKEIISNLMNMSSLSLKRKQSLDFDIDSPRKIILNQTIKNNFKLIHNKNSHISKIKTRNNFNNLIYNHKFSSRNSRAIVTMQLKKRIWTNDEKNLALTLFYKSPSTYTFLRLQKINLPSPSTIRCWIGKSKFLPGFNNLCFSQIKKKFENKDYKEKACIICFDEMYIKEFLEYSKEYDFIEGFQDLGPYGRINKSANCSLVFMACGIYSQWKLPVAYFLSHSRVNKMILKDLIIDVVNKLFDVGLFPKLIVCDQDASNQSVLKLLNISEDNPFFNVNDHKIFSLFDVPHLLKSVRNNLIGACFQKNDLIFSFKDIKDTYNLDKLSKKNKALVKITDAHIYPTAFQKMQVKLAAQVLSHAMSSAIRTSVATGQLSSKTAMDTANFIEFINNLFDCLNSESLFSNNPYNSALTHSGIVKTFLLDASKYFLNLKKIKNGKISQPPCFKGFTQTINGILQFFEEEKSNNIAFLMTNKLNQDSLEKLFSIIRQKGEYNKNPTSKTIRTSIKSCYIFALCASLGTICEASKETNNINSYANNLLKIDEAQSATNTNIICSDTESITSSCLSCTDEYYTLNQIQTDKITVKDCSVTYFAGYVAYKCNEQFNCHHCRNNLQTDNNLNDKNQLLLINKNYSVQTDFILKEPSISFNKIINRILDIFEVQYENIQHKKKIKFKLTLKIKKDDLIRKWLLDNKFESCNEHKLYIIDLILICKIFQKTQLYTTTS